MWIWLRWWRICRKEPPPCKKTFWDDRYIWAYCTRVYDGDTITVTYRCEHEWFTSNVRLAGIDCPELRTNDENEKKDAMDAKMRTTSLCLNKWVHLKAYGLDKYGRVLADVFSCDHHVNHILLNEKRAVPYLGGTKMTWKK